MELAPGDANGSKPFGIEHPVPLAVALEGGGGGMPGTPVELDDEPLLAPEAVALDPCSPDQEVGVGLGRRQSARADELEESQLELAAGDAGTGGARTLFNVGTPGRRGWRAIRSCNERGSLSCRASASLIARSRWTGRRTAARSSKVRGTVVTGIPDSTVVSSPGNRER
jgi:hypothetical protein